MFEWLKRLFGKRQVEKPRLVSRLISLNEQFEKQKQRVRELDRGIVEHVERVKALDRVEKVKKQREELARRVRPKTPLETLKEANIRNRRRRQPAKIRGMPPRSARNKRMWKLQVSKEELDEL